jgi:antitoxin component of RelBE/YafQ-DinJ toxin-antitoxin module
MRTNIYLTPKNKEKAKALADTLGLPLSRLFVFLVEYYLRNENVKLKDE